MRRLEFFCDRCGVKIAPDCASIYRIGHQASRSKIAIDLCSACEEALYCWLDCKPETITSEDPFDFDPNQET